MCYRDRNNIKLVPGDTVEYNDEKFVVKLIKDYSMATVVIAENLDTHRIETLLLRDVKKIESK
jgi:hypothetical protein